MDLERKQLFNLYSYSTDFYKVDQLAEDTNSREDWLKCSDLYRRHPNWGNHEGTSRGRDRPYQDFIRETRGQFCHLRSS